MSTDVLKENDASNFRVLAQKTKLFTVPATGTSNRFMSIRRHPPPPPLRITTKQSPLFEPSETCHSLNGGENQILFSPHRASIELLRILWNLCVLLAIFQHLRLYFLVDYKKQAFSSNFLYLLSTCVLPFVLQQCRQLQH
jgi:hypothetical protein